MQQMKRRLLWLIPAVILIALDQWTKWLAKGLSKPLVLISGVLEFSYVENDGAAWSMLSGKQTFLIIITSCMLALVLLALLKGPWKHPVVQISEMLLIAGGVGNLVDRIARGYVMDFIYVKAIDFPVFNVADCCVCIGACLLAVYVLFFSEKEDSRGDKAITAVGDDGGTAGQGSGAEPLRDTGDGAKVD